MSKIVILGGTGMAGHIARLYLSEKGHEISAAATNSSVGIDSLDVCDEIALFDYLVLKKPDYVINCVGVLVQDSHDNPERAIRINSLLPNVLSRYCKQLEIKLIHLSSDCVFSGKTGQYSEESIRDADDTYGRAKALGELNNNRDLTIRTSIIGPEIRQSGTGLFHWFIKQKGIVRGYANVFWSGVTTLELAKAFENAIIQGTTGLIQLTNGNSISKYNLLQLIKELWLCDSIQIERDEIQKSDRSLLKSESGFRHEVPSYRIMLDELKTFMELHEELYKEYETTFNSN